MTQPNFNWKNQLTVVKGDFAEEIIDSFLESKEYVVYNTKSNKAHAFDKVAMKNKEEVVIVECKAKARRNKYPDTGINVSHYNDYKKIQSKHNMRVFIFFIDEMLKEIYGNFIERLEVNKTVSGKKYPSVETSAYGKEIIYFPLENMVRIAKLTEDQADFLKVNSSRNYEYELP